MREENPIKKLKELSKKEVKRRAQAIKLLEQIEQELAPALEEILGGDEYDEEVPEGFVWLKKGLYFRYMQHDGEIQSERIGFYLTDDGLPAWGSPLENLKGRFFWEYVSYVCEWVENLPTHLQKYDKHAESSFSYLKKIAEAIEATKEKNRSE